MAERKLWPALIIQGRTASDPAPDLLSATLDDFSPIGIQDLTEQPLPAGGVWDPTFPAPPEAAPGPVHWRVFFPSSAQREAASTGLRAAHPSLTCVCQDVSDEDWAGRSQRELTAVHVGAFVVAPPWDVPEIPTGKTLVIIEPSRGFGTGHHASTRLCLCALSEIDVRDKRVLDVGTGSGVLAMAAARQGARRVLAVDVDPDAIDSARESAALNESVDAVEWVVGDFRDDASHAVAGSWDVVLANLTGGMLISSAARIRHLVGSGVLIASGFDETEQLAVQDSLHMRARAVLREDGWVGLVMTLE